MLVSGILGFRTHLLLLLFMVVLFAWMHQKWRNAVARKEEIRRLVDMVAKESALTEFEAVNDYHYIHPALPGQPQCAVCQCPTTTRCSQCKFVHYCSGKCQIMHWRRGHKEECRPTTSTTQLNHKTEFSGSEASEKQSEIPTVGSEAAIDAFPENDELGSCGTIKPERPAKVIAPGKAGTRSMAIDAFPENDELGSCGTIKPERPAKVIAPGKAGTRSISEEVQGTKLLPSKSKNLGIVDSRTSKLNNIKSSHTDEGVECKSKLTNGKMVMSDDIWQGKLGRKKSMKRAASSEALIADASKVRNSPPRSSLRSVTNDEEDASLVKGKEARSLSFNLCDDPTQDTSNGLRKSVWRKVQQFRIPKSSNNYKIIFPYDLFSKLYSSDEELYPFGLRNCGNSCYANAVLQCLAFTRPLTSYFVRGLHTNICRKKEWCFICEFQLLILKAREGETPLSPIRILSKIHKIGSRLGHGREEDAHEFLRYAVDTMQSVCLKETGAIGSLSEETTLVGLTFGGYLRSKITCMRCCTKSERVERIMDLTVEIDGDIGTLEDALKQFTAEETLDGENKYNCSRCKSFVKAKKKLSVLEAPNILTIVLKRFQSDTLGKMNKSVRFPEALDLAPYTCGKSDKSAQYSLYAVVVHRDIRNSTSTGHYVCYVKNFRGEWFGINDSTVTPVELGRVLLEQGYMLLYARHTPRAPSSLRNNVVPHGMNSTKRSLEAVPSSLSTSRTRSNSHVPSTESCKPQHNKYKGHYSMTWDHSTGNQFRDPYDLRFHHPMQRVSHMDSSSESSSIFSWSGASSCSTASTKDSVRSEDFSDFLFGEAGSNWYSH